MMIDNVARSLAQTATAAASAAQTAANTANEAASSAGAAASQALAGNPHPLTSNIQTESYTLQLSDANNVVEMNSAEALTLTVPPNSAVAFPVDTIVTACQLGAGQLTLAAGEGVDILTPSTLTARTQNSTLTLRQRAVNIWIVSGDLTAAS
jgi:hypothetical protein